MRTLALLLVLVASALVAGAPTSGSRTCPSSGRQTVTTTSVKVATYSIQTPVTNTGSICWGGTTVTTSTAPCLLAGMSYTPPSQGNANAYDLSTVFMACTVNTDVLKWTEQ